MGKRTRDMLAASHQLSSAMHQLLVSVGGMGGTAVFWKNINVNPVELLRNQLAVIDAQTIEIERLSAENDALRSAVGVGIEVDELLRKEEG